MPLERCRERAPRGRFREENNDGKEDNGKMAMASDVIFCIYIRSSHYYVFVFLKAGPVYF